MLSLIFAFETYVKIFWIDFYLIEMLLSSFHLGMAGTLEYLPGGVR